VRDNKTINFAGLNATNQGPQSGNNDALALLRIEIDELRSENQLLRQELERALASQADAHSRQDGRVVQAPRTGHQASVPVLTTDHSSIPQPFASPTGDSFDRSSRANFTPPAGASVASATMSRDGIDFGAIAKLTPDKLDGLPYGLITLDSVGRVIHYNDTEARLVGLPKDRVIGKNFFTDVAPCTRLREFEGRFMELAADPIKVRVQTFDFVFRFAKGEQHVTVVITPARARGQFHMALIRRLRDA
jgi:photoactive yellow protein